jgi:hypothetical protein
LLAEQGILYGEHNFIIADADDLIVTDEDKAAIIRKLLDDNIGEDVWAQFAESNPDIATRLANAQLQTDRAAILRQFKEMLGNNNLTEGHWQDFFEANTWIFGYGLRYQILRVVQTQPNYGGTNISGRGGQRGDFLTATEAETKFTCLVEIKKPTTLLLQTEEYRNGAWGVSGELSGAVSQVQVNCENGKSPDHEKMTTVTVWAISRRSHLEALLSSKILSNWTTAISAILLNVCCQ